MTMSQGNVTVEFFDVGRDKKSWTAKVPFNDRAIALEAKYRGGLLSSDVEAIDGQIIVGGFRTVGLYKIKDAPA